MFCTSCGASLQEGSKFCTSCGNAVATQLKLPPDGFLHDPKSGLYYITTRAPNPETGANGQWVTWYYPETKQFKQVFTADQ